ncbi:MAG: dockerin type I repeat-containing protein [Clostridia bacterium]|nr:dockerin type I repeat-containing protein [Clostridia bacterium]
MMMKKSLTKLFTVLCLVIFTFICTLNHTNTLTTVSAENTDKKIFLPGLNSEFKIITYNDKIYSVSNISSAGIKSGFYSDSIKIIDANLSGKYLIVTSASKSLFNIILVNLNSGHKDGVMIHDISSDITRVCADAIGNVYLVDQSDRKTISEYSYKGAFVKNIKLNQDIEYLFTDMDNTYIFAVTKDGLYNVTLNKKLNSDIPLGDFHFNQRYCYDSGGNVFELFPETGFQKIITVLYSKMCYNGKNVYAVEGTKIVRLDNDGVPSDYFDTGVGIDDLLTSSETVAYITNGEIKILNKSLMTKIENTSPEDSNNTQTKERSQTESHIPDYEIKSGSLSFSEGLINDIKQGTTLAGLKREISYGDNVLSVINHNGKEVKSGVVGTGWQLIFFGEGSKKVYYTVIKGDITGEGNINKNDCERFSSSLIGTEKLTEPQKKAADIDNNNTADISDLYQLYNMF